MLCLLINIHVHCLEVQCTNGNADSDCLLKFDSPTVLNKPDKLNVILADTKEIGNIRRIELKNNSNLIAPALPIELFEQFPNLESLKFAANVLELSKSDFANAKSLQEIILGWNQLKRVPDEIFANAKQLRNIELDHNDIDTIEDGAFDGLENLLDIQLSWNRLTRIGRNTFGRLHHLRTLSISNNLIEQIDDGALRFEKLEALDLSNNQLKTLSSAMFVTTPLLNSLNINKNKVEQVNDALYGLQELGSLHLGDNKIQDLDITKLARMRKLWLLDLQRSGFNLDRVDIATGEVASSKSSVKELNLAGNEMENDKVFEKLKLFPKLQNVTLNDNRLRTLDLESIRNDGLPSLVRIEVLGNDFDAKWLDKIKEIEGIVVDYKNLKPRCIDITP